MSEALKPCPFCGHEHPTFERMGTSGQSCIVACGNCGCRHESGDEYLNSGRSWNDRPDPSPAAHGATTRETAQLLQPDDLAALDRVNECFEDGEGWDVPKATMQRLAELGVVRRHTGNHYSVTSFGQYVVREWSVVPLQTFADAIDAARKVTPPSAQQEDGGKA